MFIHLRQAIAKQLKNPIGSAVLIIDEGLKIVNTMLIHLENIYNSLKLENA